MLWLKNLPLYRKFQSTPPARGATFPDKSCIFIDEVFQSTPPARGAT